MIISLCILMIIILIVAVKSKNIYSYSLTTGILAIWLLLFSLVLYISRISVYDTLFAIEKPIYLLIKRMSISYFDIMGFVNAAITTVVISNGLLFLHDTHLCRYKALRIIVVFTVVGMAAALLFVFNSARMYERIFIYSNMEAMTDKGELLQRIISVLNYMVLSVGLISYIKLAYQAVNTRLVVTRRRLTAVLVGMLAIEIVFLCLLFMSPITSFFGNFNIYKFNTIAPKEQKILNYFSLFIVMLICAILIFANKHRIFGNKKEKEIDKNNILVRDIRHIFHNYKNALYTISLLADEALEAHNLDEAEYAMEKIKKNVSQYTEKANRFLDIYNNVYANYKDFCIGEVLESVREKITLPDNTDLEVLYDASAVTYGSVDEIEDMLINILINACEAIEKKKIDNGVIVLEVFVEKQWICISIKDNGVGMDRKTIRNIFTPLFSTKRTFNNWGIGLSYAKSVAEAHGGEISVRSAVGKGTEFQITLIREEI